MAYELNDLPEHLGTINFNGKRYEVLKIDHYDETGRQAWHLKDETGAIVLMEYERPSFECRTV
ncbi:hypothetical protein ACQKGD_10745 [Peribacillus frigoritolerans]|uniref:hypothetical protein n=1 Tax=Peribacillus frigoritolerans TaxID=450367 RepID=UPI003D00AD66